MLTLPEAGFAERNERIVACSDLLVACPRDTPARSPRSGTWQTVRMARAAGLETFVVWTDGRVEALR